MLLLHLQRWQRVQSLPSSENPKAARPLGWKGSRQGNDWNIEWKSCGKAEESVRRRGGNHVLVFCFVVYFSFGLGELQHFNLKEMDLAKTPLRSQAPKRAMLPEPRAKHTTFCKLRKSESFELIPTPMFDKQNCLARQQAQDTQTRFRFVCDLHMGVSLLVFVLFPCKPTKTKTDPYQSSLQSRGRFKGKWPLTTPLLTMEPEKPLAKALFLLV